MRRARPSQDTQSLSLSNKVRFVAAGLSITIGLIVLIGWSQDIMAFTQILPGLTAMNPMTAVCLILAAIALASHRLISRQALWALSTAIFSVGAAKLLQLTGLLNLPVDKLLYASKLGEALGVAPNQMAPNTALALVITAIAIGTSKARLRRTLHVSQALCFAIIAVTLFAIIGYALGIVSLYGLKNFNPMAVHTAFALMIIAAGLLSANPRTGIMRVISDDGPSGQLSRLMLPLVVLIPIVLGRLRLEGQERGYYDLRTGVTLQVFANVLVTFSLLMMSIVLLYRADLARRGRERSLRRSEEEFRLAEELGRVGHWRVNVETDELECSAELIRICGLPEGERPARNSILALHHPEDAAAHLRCTEQALNHGIGWDENRRISRPDGEDRIIRSHGTVHRDEHGKIASLFGVFVDITELESARQRAEAAIAVKADFLANMSHEIRTPLNSIIGFTDLVLDDDGISEVHRRQLRLVKNSGGALLTVVNDILDFSKMEAGKTEIAVRPFDLVHTALGTVAIIRQSAEAKGLELTVETGDLSGYFLGDDGRLRQILLNLLSNAVKFTRHGSVSLTIARAIASGPDILRFAVADTGIGVSPSDEHRLFSQFSQANSSISRDHGGTGLGLAICKSLVELMGGTIGYRRTSDQGSEFWFELDLQPTDESYVESCAARRVQNESLRILVAEDVEANQELATAMLERAGHEVVVVNHGREALASVQRADFDLILMDVQMPVMDGVTATKLIRLMPGKPRTTPIIALTANILPEQIDVFLKAGMNDHVGKPISFAELTEAIARNAPLGNARRAERAFKYSVREPGFDRTAFANLATMLPADRLKVHSLALQTALLSLKRFEGTTNEIKSLVHSMISQAGMFGFVRLSALCRELENADDEAWPPNELVAAIQAAATAAQSKLNELRVAARLSA